MAFAQWIIWDITSFSIWVGLTKILLFKVYAKKFLTNLGSISILVIAISRKSEL